MCAIRSLIPYACDVFVIMNSLSKDATSQLEVQRSAALRTLGMILSDQTLSTLERHFKQGIVDKAPTVATNALATAVRLVRTHPDVVGRWIPEITTALSSNNHLVQLHAVRLLHALKQSDKTALVRLVSTYGKQRPLRSPFAHCELIRICLRVLRRERAFPQLLTPLVEYLQTCLRPNNDVVAIEAMKAVAQLELDAAPQSLSAALMNTIQVYLQNHRPILRYAAIRTVSEMTARYSELVATVRVDVEALLREPNRAILTLAIATSLNVCNEASVEGLLAKVGKFMPDLPDAFRLRVVQTVEQLGERFPAKQVAFLTFLSHLLAVKSAALHRAAVAAIHRLSAAAPKIREHAITILSDYIEDCEYPELVVTVFEFIGAEGPRSQKPLRVLRSVYNRFLLESPPVRAAAVTTIARFADVPELKDAVMRLLDRCAHDPDDEVRDRAVFYRVFLDTPAEGSPLAADVSLDALQASLEAYLAGDCSAPCDLAAAAEQAKAIETFELPEPEASPADEPVEGYGACLREARVPLTPIGSEYEVVCRRLLFPRHLVLVLEVTNTLPDCVLTNVAPAVVAQRGSYALVEATTLEQLPAQSTGALRLVFERADELKTEIDLKMTFTLKESADDEMGDDDEYVLDTVALGFADFVGPMEVVDFGAQFESLAADASQTQAFKFPAFKSCAAAVEGLAALLGMAPVEETGTVKPNAQKHVLFLAGTLLLERPATVMVRVRSTP